ncbi:MAG: cellulose synthase family protein [Ferruginibacter sp.]
MTLYISYIIIIIYSLSLLMIFLYSLSQLSLLRNYIQSKKHKDDNCLFDLANAAEVPSVTVQLPVYNEKYVIERLLHCISRLDYPKSKLQIQVLDDSTDDSVVLTMNIVAQLKEKGFNIDHVRRNLRTEFKAGALKEGLQKASGEFIAIFDADFLPEPDWLKRAVIYFKDTEVGVVQSRWGHLNLNYSTLTKIQAFALDAHFTLEQAGRNAKNYFINFNGTAGIWRKQCILDAGNWMGATLTEDLDLSYRAQLKKWKFKYVEDLVTPAELPVAISAARSQQFRWNKGGAENFMKYFRRILRSKSMSFSTKVHGFLHLANSSMFLFVLILAVLSVPMLYIKNKYQHLAIIFEINSLFIVSTLILFICHWVSYKNTHEKKSWRFVRYIRMFFTFFTIALGFSWHNSVAVMEAYRGKKSDFIRTPKFNVTVKTDNWKDNIYLAGKISLNVIIETILLLYFGFGIASAFLVKDYALLPFHIMLITGFSYVVYHSINND